MMEACKIWIEKCDAARMIEDEFGTDKALTYLIGEKFVDYLDAAESLPSFRAELPAFVAEIKTIFETWQLEEFLKTARQSEPFDRGPKRVTPEPPIVSRLEPCDSYLVYLLI